MNIYIENNSVRTPIPFSNNAEVPGIYDIAIKISKNFFRFCFCAGIEAFKYKASEEH